MIPYRLYIRPIPADEDSRRKREELALAALIADAVGPGIRRISDTHGAPILIDRSGAPYPAAISVSHSRRSVAMTLAQPGAGIGVDIEEDRYNLPRVCRRILSGTEYGAYRHCLLHAWTAKEAVYKATRRLLYSEPEYARDIKLHAPEMLRATVTHPDGRTAAECSLHYHPQPDGQLVCIAIAKNIH